MPRVQSKNQPTADPRGESSRRVKPARAAGRDVIDWRSDAACLNEKPELFFPTGNVGAGLVQTNRAKQVCAGCRVRTACLEWAIATNTDYGVWGGLSEDDRRSLKRRTARARAAAAA